MEYIICQKPGKFEILEKEKPKRKKGEVLLSIKKIGICGTDFHAFQGRQAYFQYPRILGHEIAATVVEIENNLRGIKAGDKVITVPYIACGTCNSCKNGKTNCCSEMKVIGVHEDGGMQKLLSVPQDNILPAGTLSLDEVVIVEPLAIGAHALRRAQIKRHDLLVVIGCGPIGLGIIKIAKIVGASVIAVDINQERLSYAKKFFDADYIVNANEDPVLQIRKITNGDLANCVIDATGSKSSMEDCPSYLSHGGNLVFVGLTKDNITFSHPEIHAKECSILCSRNATLEDFEFVKTILSKELFPVYSYITHRSDFRKMINEFNHWLRPESGVIKSVISF